MEDLEGELERKIKLLEKERQTMRKETHGEHEKIHQGINAADHRVTEMEHSEWGRWRRWWMWEEEEEVWSMGGGLH